MREKIFIGLQHLAPQHLLSKLAGRIARSRRDWIKRPLIARFIRAYDVNMDESAQTAESFANFNAFFTRELKADARPLADAAKHILSPADGAISQIGTIEEGRIFQAKGQDFSAAELLGADNDFAARFEGGSFATIYLSPKDYHRVHMPLAGRLRQTTYIPGDLFSVNTVTAQNVPRLFARNERLSCLFDIGGKDGGKDGAREKAREKARVNGSEKADENGSVMASVMVGAMIVASMETVWGGLVQPHGKQVVREDFRAEGDRAVQLQAGDEMGRFLLGSTVVLLFEPGVVQWDKALQAGSALRMGQSLGTLL